MGLSVSSNPGTNNGEFLTDPAFLKCRHAFEIRCNDLSVRNAELESLRQLFRLTESLGDAVRFWDSSANIKTSIVFRRTCDPKPKELWKAVVQNKERKLEILPRGYFAKRMDIYPAFAALWNLIPRDKGPASTPVEVPSLRLRYVCEPNVWSHVEACIRWASDCR